MNFKKIFKHFLCALLVLAVVPCTLYAGLYHKANSETELLNGQLTPRFTTDASELTYYISTSVNFASIAPYVESSIAYWNSPYDIDLTEASSYSTSICDFK